MLKTIVSTTLLSSVLLVTGCATTPTLDQQTQNLSLLQNKQWVLTYIGATKYKATTVAHSIPSIQFGSDLRVSGSDGCNRLMGQYAIKGEHLTLGQLGSTQMLCQDRLHLTEQYASALNKVKAYQVYGKTLKLLDQYGNRVLEYKTQ